MRIARAWWLVLLVGSWGCGSDDDGGDGSNDGASFDIASGALSGKIGGKVWSFVAGEATSVAASEGELRGNLYASPASGACQGVASFDEDMLILRLPKAAGDYRLSFSSLNATFFIAGSNDNLVATRGRLVLDEVTSSSVRGGAHLVFDADNEVSGRFQLPVCD